VIVAIKRLTIELDDQPETERRTSPPSSLLPKQGSLPGAVEETDVPERQEQYREVEAEKEVHEASGAKDTIGRTPADLVYAFINQPEFMAVTFTVVALIITIGKIQKLTDWWFTVVAAVMLNTVWFGVRLFTRSRS
jgi:hypothetical protein